MITVEQVLSWGPCEGYEEDKLQEIAAKIDLNTVSSTAGLIRRLQGVISTPDILWLVLREKLIPAKTLHELSCWFAAASLHREREYGREPAPESWAAVETKWRWTQGHTTDSERETAREAAWAAWAAARAAAWAAAEAAAREAAEEEQLEMVLSLIEGSGE